MSNDSASSTRSALLSIMSPPPLDALDVFLALERRLCPESDKLRPDSFVPSNYVSPSLLALCEELPALCAFVDSVNCGRLADEQAASLYVAVRLFGVRWKEFSPDVGRGRLLRSIERYIANHKQADPCPLELLEISRVFRLFLRPDEQTRAHHAKYIANYIVSARNVVADAFNADKRSDSYRIALFLYTLRQSDRVDKATRRQFVAFIARNSFARRKDIKLLGAALEHAEGADEESIRLAIACFRSKPAR